MAILTIEQRADAILKVTHRGNLPHPDHPGKRIIGWIVDEDLAGLSDGLFALEEIQSRAVRGGKCQL